jgi:hypothetical protein
MGAGQIQDLCEIGQEQLSRMDYLAAEKTLAAAEELAWNARDFDSLARLYMPLQESRRQRRQRCGEGTVHLDVLAKSEREVLDGAVIAASIQWGQTLIAGWASLEPALQARQAQMESDLYLDVFLAAVYPAGTGRIVAIVPMANVALPPNESMTVDSLIRRLPAHTIVMSDAELPAGPMGGSPQTYARVMAIWERLHAPFLAAADATADPIRRIDAYRKTIAVDYACELAHQRISDTARKLCAKGTS